MPSSSPLGNLSGRRVTIFGLAREGLDLARFLSGEGARVLVTDRKPASELQLELDTLADLDLETCLGGHPFERVLEAEIIFVSPGIPPGQPALVEARRRGLPLSSATALLFARCPARIVGITGSSGKSTTTALVGEMLRQAGQHVFVGGNIGRPLLGRLAELKPESVVVLELSSFQLETVDRSPAIAAVTNITPNHLDRHPSMGAYIAAKERIFQFQSPADWTVLNADDRVSASLRPPGKVVRFSLAGQVEGAFLEGGRLMLNLPEQRAEVSAVGDLALPGRHNLANALTACAVAGLQGATPGAMRSALRSFSGLEHRLQKVGELGRVLFVDDSIATSPERSMAGLAAFETPVVLLAGGRDKHLPMDDWARAIRRRAAAVVMFGEARELISCALQRAGYPADRTRVVDSLPSAVRAGFELAEPGQVVLLSPGCTSYDMFRDFVERGQVFAAAVNDLAREMT